MKKVAIYARVSTDRSQTVENQLVALRAVGERLGWAIVTVHADVGISGAKSRDRRPGFDALLRGVARREFDLVAAWSVDRLGRSLQDLVGLLGDLQARGIDLYLHQQGLDTSTPSGRMLFQMLGVFSEFERAMIRERILAGLERAKGQGRHIGRPPMAQDQVRRIQEALAGGAGVRQVARLTGASPTTVSRIRQTMLVEQQEQQQVVAA
jgi:DNA invertase Pin-like site-specific DNA recombinase